MTLKSTLTTNGVFSGLTGIASVVAAGPLANLLDVAATGLLVVLGLGLIGYAFGLFLTAARLPRTRGLAWTATVLDTTWVFGSILLIEAGLLTAAGNALVGVVAVPVLLFAVLQFRGLRQPEPDYSG